MESDSSSSESDIVKPTFADILLLNQSKSYETKQKKRYYGKKRYKNTKTQVPHVKITDELMEKMIIDDFNGKYFSGYVKYIKSNFKDCLDKATKSSQKSIEARIKANELFAAKPHDAQIHKDICELYSKSIAFAHVGSKELVLAYECRSNLLLHLKKYGNCVSDIDRALALTTFDLLKVKLLCRKMTCYTAMNKSSDEKQNLWVTLNHHLEKIDDVFKDEKFLKLVEQAKIDSHSQSKEDTTRLAAIKIELKNYYDEALKPYFDKALEIIYNKEIRIVANCDIPAGKMIVITKPLVISFNPNKFYAYCSHCLRFMWAGVPCDKCSLCMYCSDKCKLEAWEKYHSAECKILPHINIESIHYNVMHMSTRVLLKAIKEFDSISRLREKIKEIDELRDDCKLNENLLDSDFLQFYASLYVDINSTTHSLDSVNSKAMTACFLIACLIQTSDIFEKKNFKILKGKELAKDQDIITCAFVLLKIMILCTRNIKAATRLYAENAKCGKYTITDCNNSRHCIKGTYYDTYHAMFEKSCNPNVAACWTDSGNLFYYSVQPIKKMEKITICQYSEFFLYNKATRDKYAYFYIYCQCTACLKNWPTMKELYAKTKQRRSTTESREAKIVQKYLEKNQFTIHSVLDTNCAFSAKEYNTLLQDVNDVVKVCGQPSFSSSLMINYLCVAFEKRFGTKSLISHFPANC